MRLPFCHSKSVHTPDHFRGRVLCTPVFMVLSSSLKSMYKNELFYIDPGLGVSGTVVDSHFLNTSVYLVYL